MISETKTLVERWLPSLAQQTGRSAHELLSQGLLAGDFAPSGVTITFEDGSRVAFRWAFAIRSVERPGIVGVFTEHCGYHEFPLGPDDHLQ